MLGVKDPGRDQRNLRTPDLKNPSLLVIHHQSSDLLRKMLDVPIISFRFGSLGLHLLLNLFVDGNVLIGAMS